MSVPVRSITEDVMLACTRASLDPVVSAKVSGLLETRQVAWEWLLDTASAHGILPLVYHNLSQAEPGLVPPVVLARLARRCRAIAAQNLAFSCELIAVTELLRAEGIRALPFKGTILSGALYGTPCLRKFVDIDVLVPGGDAQRALGLLLNSGYEAEDQSGGPSPQTHCALVHPATGARIELQWDLGTRWGLRRTSPRAPLDFEDLWCRRETISIVGRALPSLSAEDLAIVLSVHAARHLWSRVIWISDMGALVRTRPAIDWPRVFAMAAELGCRRRLHLSMFLAAELLDAELPAMVRAEVERDPALASIALRLERLLFARPAAADLSEPDPRTMASDVKTVSLDSAIRDCRWERLQVWTRFLWLRLLPNACDRRIVRLPSAMALAYYPIRFARLFWTYGRPSALGLLARTAERTDEDDAGTATSHIEMRCSVGRQSCPVHDRESATAG